VRKAIAALAADNLVIRRQGKGDVRRDAHGGAIVAFPIPADPPQRRRRRASRKPTRRRAPWQGFGGGGPRARSQAGDPVILLRRVLEFSGEPVILDEITCRGALQRLTKARIDAYPGSMYSFFETQFGVQMLKAQERLRAFRRRPQAPRLLGVRVGDPLLAVDRVTLTYGDRPVEWRRGLCVTKRYHYFNEIG
jgi:GntR family transcriptional regulator